MSCENGMVCLAANNPLLSRTYFADIKQASFVAFNVEPEEDSEDELDDTKEIQV